MVNTILDAVTKHLGNTFGNKYRYYVEDVQQGFRTPAFVVGMITPMERSRNARLYDRTMPLVIHYFSDSENELKKDCYSMAEKIIECLEYLPVDDSLLRGERLNWQIAENVLEVFVTYKFMSIKDSNIEDSMDSYKHNIDVKMQVMEFRKD